MRFCLPVFLLACGPQGGVKLPQETGADPVGGADTAVDTSADTAVDTSTDTSTDTSMDTAVDTSAVIDEDADGFDAAGDCDDSDPDVHPGAIEVCDGRDNNCDGVVDEGVVTTWYADLDGDGFGDASAATTSCEAPDGYVASAVDCDDTNAGVFPSAPEVCNGIDDDCDTLIDAADDSLDIGILTEVYADLDGDGFGDPASASWVCDVGAGQVADASDCDDTDAAVNPAASERCNGIDDNCDGAIDEASAVDVSTWYADNDGDGFGDAGFAVASCDAPLGYVADATDCDDTAADIHPSAPEPCGGTDLDCDGADPELCTSCAQALADGYTTDGLYTVDVDGLAGALAEVDVWCDQTTDGGGWTLIQRTVWDWADTSLLFTGYADWYGSNLGDANPGEVFRLAGTDWSVVGAGGEMLAIHQDRDSTSLGDCDPLYYTGSGGTVTVTATDASLGALASSVFLTNVPELSTTDSGPSAACVTGYDAVPWFYSTCCTTCPSFQASYWSDEAHPMASYTDTSADVYGKTAADVCPSGVALPNENGGGYEGINVMEVYLR